METNTKPRRPLQYYMRTIHRVLGYLTLGFVMVYALSGITLIYRAGNFMKRDTHIEQTLQPGLNVDQLASALKIKGFQPTEETGQTIYFTDGQYDKQTGKATYVQKTYVTPFNKFINLHKLPAAKDKFIGIVNTVFGSFLFLLALTALFMYKPSSKQFKANMLFLGIGVAIVILMMIAA